MDTLRTLAKSISIDKDANIILNSYRIFRRLETYEQTLIRALQVQMGYTPVDFALALYKLSGRNLEEILEWVRTHPKMVKKCVDNLSKGYIPKNLSHPKRIRILEFHGFIPIDEIPKHVLHEGFAYITSNMTLNDKLYIYPERLYDDYKNKDLARNWQQVFESFCLPGLIRIYYSFEYKYIKNNYDRTKKH